MNALLLSIALTAPSSADADARAALALAMATPPRVTPCLCGSGCTCGPACDCPTPAPVTLPPIRRTITQPVTIYPHQMAPMHAFRPMMPAPMYFGGFGGGFGGCGPGGCR